MDYLEMAKDESGGGNLLEAWAKVLDGSRKATKAELDGLLTKIHEWDTAAILLHCHLVAQTPYVYEVSYWGAEYYTLWTESNQLKRVPFEVGHVFLMLHHTGVA